jgi:hypothetical protein
LVREPAFKQWFGDWENSPENSSKVVDENGEPLPVYHGTNYSDFTEFDDLYIGNNTNNAKSGFYFTNNYLSALSYTESDWDWREEDEKDESTDERDILYCFLNIRNPLEKNYSNKYLYESDWSFSDLALEKNKDGAIQYNVIDNWSFGDKNKKEDYIGNNYIVFNSNQIKLSDGSNTTFDSNNPDIRFEGGGEARPFTDDGNKLVVFNEYRNYNPYKIAVDDVNDANYITLWKTDTNTGKDKKVGSLKLNQTPDDFLSVSEISIDRNSKALGLGLEMYKIALKYSSNKIKGIKSYLPNRSNKRQIPKIYRKLNSVKEGDWDIIYKKNNPDIRFDDGGVLPDNIFDYLKEKGFEPLGNGLRSKSNCTIKMDFSNVLYQAQNDNRVWISPIEYSDYKKAFTILEFHCRDKNKGIGTAVLEEIIRGADLFGYTIFIEPTSMKKYRVETDINTDDLKRWYSKFDFKPINNNYSNYVWLRSPKNPDIS